MLGFGAFLAEDWWTEGSPGCVRWGSRVSDELFSDAGQFGNMGFLQCDDEVKEDLIAMYSQLYCVRRWSQTFLSGEQRKEKKQNQGKFQ